MNTIVAAHMRRYTCMAVVDLYKLIHQSAMGGGHAAPDLDAALEYLRKEAGGLPPGPPEPLVDVISPDGLLARIHLRPYIETGRPLEPLAQAFVQSADVHIESTEILENRWEALVNLARSGDLPIDAKEMGLLSDRMAPAGYPPVYHSPEFRTTCRPAYRVVRTDVLAMGSWVVQPVIS